MADNYIITGIQQVGVGTTSVYDSWKWLSKMFGADVRVLEDDTVAERMLPYTGGEPHRRHAAIAVNLQGGGGFEIWQYSERTPKKPDFEIEAGDLGIFMGKVRSRDVKAAYAYITARWDKTGKLCSAPDGSPTFLVQDPGGNMFQIVEDDYAFLEPDKPTGGMYGAMIGVTDIEKSLEVYRDILCYDQVIYDKEGTFSDLEYMKGGNGRFRRVLLKSSSPMAGPFAPIFLKGTIELVQALDRKPRKIFEGRYWGDPGFIQVCYDVTNMDNLHEKCKSLGYPFTVDSCPDGMRFDMGDASGRFTYIEDPDGTLIEFVETYKCALIRKLGLYKDLTKRKDRTKPLPKFMFRAMLFNKVKFKN